VGFFLHIDVKTSLPPAAFSERVLEPLKKALERERVGRLLEGDAGDVPGESYELALEVTDHQRARELVEEVLKSVDG
jgi:hypothetical protein